MNSPIDASINFGAKDLLMSGGVSRSGRVLKKSAKLLDFQAIDEVDKKPRKSSKNSGRRGRIRRTSGVEFEVNSNDVDEMGQLAGLADLVELNDSAVDLDLNVKLLAEATGVTDENLNEQIVSNTALLESLLNTDADSEDELNKIVANIVEGVEAESLQSHKNTVKSSLYMSEKANKRKIMRDGKLVSGKLARKDKGKSRYTAYSLWAREYRKSAIFQHCQETDLPNTSRRLGELWSNVSNKEKNVWRRKAKQQSLKREREKDTANLATTSGTKLNSLVNETYTTQFLNRATTSRTKKLAEAAAALAAAAAVNKSTNNSIESNKRKRKVGRNQKQIEVVNNKQDNEQKQQQKQNIHSIESDVSVQIPQEPSIQAIDAAAHLKLLGESLTIIGKRLKEHDGQIAMSGSLSVLLDSALCSLGPLMCLTTHIPGLENNEHLRKNLSSILDNIAYVLPGL